MTKVASTGKDVREVGEIAEEVDDIEAVLKVHDRLRDNGNQNEQREKIRDT